MPGWEPTSGATPLSTINITEKYFDLVTQLAPGEGAVARVGVKFHAGANGDANVQVYTRPSGEDWPTEPGDTYRIIATADELKSISFPVGSIGVYEFRVGLKLDRWGIVPLTSGFLAVQSDGVDLTTPLV